MVNCVYMHNMESITEIYTLLFSKGLEVDIHAAIYPCVLFLTQSCDKELESINDKRNTASRCLHNIISIISEVKCKLFTIKG